MPSLFLPPCIHISVPFLLLPPNLQIETYLGFIGRGHVSTLRFQLYLSLPLLHPPLYYPFSPSPLPLPLSRCSRSHELSQVRASLDVLQDALAAPAGSADPGLFSELASQAREQQKQLSTALNAATDEHFLVQVRL